MQQETMTNVISFPDSQTRAATFTRAETTYTVKEMSAQFGLSEAIIRRWSRAGLIHTSAPAETGEMRYDFRALRQFRRVRDLRGQGLSIRQIEAELRGQLSLFPDPSVQVVQLPNRMSPFEEALLLHERGEAGALDAYRRAITNGESLGDAYCNLGILEFEAGNIPAAFNCLTCSLKYDPRHFESHFNLASLYFEQGDLRLAQLHYSLAIEIQPNHADAYFSLAITHALSSSYTAAVEVLIRAKEIATGDDVDKLDELLAGLQKVLATQNPESRH
jgi:tetratricopeptide (TPR) repeat protein